MTQEEKNLLLTDLCGRLPYGVICNTSKGNGHLCSINQTIFEIEYGINSKATKRDYFNDREEIIKPYLFPLSSMTEEQKKELFELCTFCIQEDWEGKKSEVYAIEISSRADPAYCFDHNFYMWGVDMRAIDWLNKNHFDYRGLIEKGIALDATNLKIY